MKAMQLLLTLALPTLVQGQNVRVLGRVTERDSATAVPAASVRLVGTPHEAVTDATGRFGFTNVAPGTYTIELKRIGYADHTETLRVPNTTELQLTIHMDVTAVGLPSVTVTVMTPEERARRAEGTASRLLTLDEIQSAVEKNRKFEDVVRSSGFGLRVREGNFTADGDFAQRILCIETASRGRTSMVGSGGGVAGGSGRYPRCNMVPVFLDGVKIGNAGAYLRGVPLENFERIEWLNAIAAGTRFGVLSENKGVLVLTTRTGKR